MSRSIVFDSPFLLGFEHTRALAERAAKAAAEDEDNWDLEWGDRNTELVLIGLDMDKAAVLAALEGATMTDAEMAAGDAPEA